MREILFKAKRLDNGEWVEGNLILSNDAEEDYKTIIIPNTDADMFVDGCVYQDLGFEKWYIVDPSTICQYTGLTDKNGKKIWENDIVKCYSFDCSGREVEFISDVFWDDCSWLLHEEEYCDGMLFYFDKNIKFESHVSEIEVIGNRLELDWSEDDG